MNTLKYIVKNPIRDDSSQFIWMLPFSTLMLVLMILFAALYSYSYMNSLEYESAMTDMRGSRDMSPERREIVLAQSMKKFLDETNMQGIAQVSITPYEIKLKISSPVVFDTGDAELKPEIMPLLVELYWHLKDMDNMIIVEGHTDNVPILGGKYGSNWELSAARAFSVIYFFLKRNISPDRLVAHGYGEFRPFFSNDTELGRAMNRRIELTILRHGGTKR